jgi:formylglycine-generating enzyme required for sulfatase activity
MFSSIRRMVLPLSCAWAVLHCTEPVPDYCESDRDCKNGYFCDVERKTCVPLPDGGLQDTGLADGPAQDTGLADGPAQDTGPADGPAPDTGPADGPAPDTGPADGPPPHDTAVPDGPPCGNNTINSGEECDGSNLNGKTCQTLGYDGGTLTCSSSCTFDKTQCYKCGDGVKNGGEECDMIDLGGVTCVSKGFTSGTPGCTSSCTLHFGGCHTAGYVHVIKGSFMMGSPTTEPCREPKGIFKETQHNVTLARDFEISAEETTQGAFQAAMSYNPSSNTACGSDCPVESVTWHEAAAYCNALSAQKGLTKCYSCTGSGATVACVLASGFTGTPKTIYDCPGYRLPTEAEWEYAYRAKTTPAYYNGPNDGTKCDECTVADANLDKIAWYCFNAGNSIHTVGLKTANVWGILDMSGNVHEWCHDGFVDDLGPAAQLDPLGPEAATARVVRGGAYNAAPKWHRAAFRDDQPGLTPHHSVGFRAVRTLQ